MWGQPPSAVQSSEARLLLHSTPANCLLRSAGRSITPNGASRLLTAKQLNPIPERIVYMAAPHARNIVRLDHFNSRLVQPLQEMRIVAAAQSRVRFLCGTKLEFNSQMNLHRAALKPASAALGEFRRFRCLSHAEHIAIERTRPTFFACRHGKLNMIDCKESWLAHAEILEEVNKK